MYERDTQSTTSADTTTQPLASDEREEGILILGGTPIGNLSDASDRLRQALATADRDPWSLSGTDRARALGTAHRTVHL